MSDARKRFFQRGPGQKAHYAHKRRAKNDRDNNEDEIVEMPGQLNATEAYEAGMHDVPPPTNDQPITAESGLDAVHSLWRLPYMKQVKKKRETVLKSLRRALRELETTYNKHNKEGLRIAREKNIPFTDEQSWEDVLTYSKSTGRGILCPLSTVFESPELEGYRNKNEFTLGVDMDGKKAAGFQIGRYAEGESRIGTVKGCRTAPAVALSIADLVAEFMQNSPHSTWEKANHSGFFRLITIRNSEALGQLMVVIQVNPTAIEGGVEGDEFKKFVTEFKEFFVSRCFGGDLTKSKAEANNYVLPPTDIDGYEELQTTVPQAAGQEFAKQYDYSLTCLGIQVYDGVSNAAPDTCPYIQVFGQKSIFDVLAGLTFRVDLNSFFQVNNKGAEMLYKKAGQWALAPKHDFDMPAAAILERYATPAPELKRIWYDRHSAENKLIAQRAAEADGSIAATNDDAGDKSEEDTEDIANRKPKYAEEHDYPVVPLPETSDVEHANKTLLLDICCGTGTIGLIMSRLVREVVGLELVPAAIEDAKFNAKLNNISNASFVCGKAEATIRGVLNTYSSSMDMAVGIVDPPRSGLHNDVIRALRSSKLNRIVYVSCNSNSLADNLVRLCGPRSKKYEKEPFVPIAAISLDMFPHTPHCEVIMILERMPEELVAKKKEARKVIRAEKDKLIEIRNAERAERFAASQAEAAASDVAAGDVATTEKTETVSEEAIPVSEPQEMKE